MKSREQALTSVFLSKIRLLLKDCKEHIEQKNYTKARDVLKDIKFPETHNEQSQWLLQIYQNINTYCILPNICERKFIRYDLDFTKANGIFSPYGNHVAFFDNKQILLYNFDKNSFRKLHNMPTPPEIPPYTFNKTKSILAWSNLIGSKLYFWDFHNKSFAEKTMQKNQKKVQCIAFSPDSKFLVYTTKKNLLIWDVLDKKLLFERGSRFGFKECAFTWDSKWLVIGGSLGLHIFNLQKKQVQEFSEIIPIQAKFPRFAYDTTLVAAFANKITVYPQFILSRSKKSNQKFRKNIPFRFIVNHQRNIRNLAISPHQDIFVTVGDKDMIVWNMQNFNQMFRVPVEGKMTGGINPRIIFPKTDRKIILLTDKLQNGKYSHKS